MTESTDQGVVVTNKDIYIKVLELSEKINAVPDHRETLKDHENRIRSVEKWKYTVPPSALTALIALLLQLLGGHHG